MHEVFMKILELINQKTLIITSNTNKKRILAEIDKDNKLYDIKFMTLLEYQKNYLFDYDVNAIYYLVKNKKIKVSNAITLLDNLYYIENKEYHSHKLNYLKEIKKELDDNNLLIYNKYFKLYLDTVKVIVYGYDELDKFSLNLFSDALFINEDVFDKEFNIYQFNNIENEVEFVFNRISDLLIKGIDINKIKLMNITSEYIPYLKRFSKFYQLPLDFPSDSLYGTKIINEFLELIKNNTSKQEIIHKLSHYEDSNLYKVIISIMNKYLSFDNLIDVYELILDDIKKTTIPKNNFVNIIKLISLNDFVMDDEYVFLLGFNNGNIPLLYKDEDYITDNIKDEVIMSKTIELNKISTSNTIKSLKRINHLVISFKKKTPFDTYFPSNLIDELNACIIEEKTDSYLYSDLYNKIKYANLLDEYVKYGDFDSKLGILYYNYGHINYATYNNSYKEINKASLSEYLNNKLTLSYSSIDNYYKCAFRYYITNILNLSIYEETFDTIIGNIFHYVLSKAFGDNFDFEKEFDNCLKDYPFNHKEIFFINKLKSDLIFIIETIKEYQRNTGLTKELYEQKIVIPLMNNPQIEFKGFIDKIMYKEKDNHTYLSIIDYKTGNPSIKIDYLKYGLSMQLPLYLYLTSKSNLFHNIKYCGFYLQHILDNEIKIDQKKTFIEQKKENLKLQGFSTSDINRLAMFDDSYENSMMIKGMKTKLDGNLVSNAKVLSDSEIDEIINLCEEKIKLAISDILEGKFTINPKIIKDKNVGCQYCKYRDLCYHKEKDNLYLESEVE